MTAENRPGRAGYFVAAVLSLAGIAAGVLLLIHVVTQIDGDARFLAPGSHVITVEKAGKQVIWNDYRTIFEGRSYDVPERLPDGLRIRVTETASGKPLDVDSDRSSTSKGGDAERHSIASFEVTAPGRYTITIEGDFPPRVFSVGPSILLKIFGTIFAVIGLVVLGFAAGLALAIWTFLRRNPVPATPVQPAATPAADPQPVPAAASGATSVEVARQAAIAVYALQAASFVVVVSMIAGVILNYIKREDVAGTWLESHYTWQIRTFWWWLAWMAVAAVLAIIVVGIAVAIVNQIWLLYRILKGWLRLSEGRPMYEQR